MFEHIFIAYFFGVLFIGALAAISDSVEDEYGE